LSIKGVEGVAGRTTKLHLGKGKGNLWQENGIKKIVKPDLTGNRQEKRKKM